MTGLDRLFDARRSVRRYTAVQPPEEHLLEMIRAASKAPSPSNRQPVRFVRIRSTSVKEKLREAAREGHERLLVKAKESQRPKKLINRANAYYRFSDFMFEAPALLVAGTVSAESDPSGILRGPHAAGLLRRDLDISVGLALMNYLLKGEELGLGSCILTAPFIYIEEPQKLIPVDDIDIRCFITTGYPAEDASSEGPPKKGPEEIYREI